RLSPIPEPPPWAKLHPVVQPVRRDLASRMLYGRRKLWPLLLAAALAVLRYDRTGSDPRSPRIWRPRCFDLQEHSGDRRCLGAVPCGDVQRPEPDQLREANAELWQHHDGPPLWR